MQRWLRNSVRLSYAAPLVRCSVLAMTAVLAATATVHAQAPAPAGANAPGAAAQPANPPPGMPPQFDLKAATEVGFGIFQQKCIACHGNPQFERAPPPSALMQFTPERVYESLKTGLMANVIGNQLSDDEKRAVSESATGQRLGAAGSGDADKMPNRCPSNPPLEKTAKLPAWNGWGADVQNTRFQSAKAAGLTAADIPHLKLKWAFGLPNSTSAYAQPTVVFGRVFVGSDTGYIYSLDAKTGCVYWSFKANHGVRNAMTIGPAKGPGATKYAVYFGDLKANAYAVDAQTGQQLWTTKIEENYTDRITAAPTLYEGRLYVPISSWEEFSAADLNNECCKSVGAVAAVDATTGKMLWKTYVIPERPQPLFKNSKGVQQWGPAGGSVWNSPTVDPVKHAIYFGTGDATTFPAVPTSDSVMALDMETGKVLWSYQVHKNDAFLGGCMPKPTENCPKVVGPDWDIPSSPVLRTLPDGSRRLIVGTKPGDILSLDPDKDGALVWRINVFGPIAGDGPLADFMPPGNFWGFATDRDISYFGLAKGGLAAIDLSTGKRLWLNPLNSANKVSYASANTGFPGVVLQGSSSGKLYAVAAADGHELWSFETMREFDTVNKVKAKGGSISAPGPVVANGMVFVGSGFAVIGGTPGNVILAFAPK